jgi:hypothetical protein
MVHAAAGFDYVVDRFDVKGGQQHDWFLHGMCEEEGTLHTSIALDQPLEALVPAWGGREAPKTQSDISPEHFHAYAYLRDIKKGAATAAWTATWRYDNAGLCSHILSESGTEVFRFRSPSLRRANEDDNKLNDYMSNGIMQRHSGGSSAFTAVHEPFRNAPWIESVKMEGKMIVVHYKLNGKTIEDHITLDEEEIAVTSSAGWKYTSGTTLTGKVKSVDNRQGKWSLLLDKKAPEINYIRLDFSDGGTYYCPVKSVHENRLELKDDPGFTLDENGNVRFYTFPQDRHDGPLRYTLFVTKSKRP